MKLPVQKYTLSSAWIKSRQQSTVAATTNQSNGVRASERWMFNGQSQALHGAHTRSFFSPRIVNTCPVWRARARVCVCGIVYVGGVGRASGWRVERRGTGQATDERDVVTAGPAAPREGPTHAGQRQPLWYSTHHMRRLPSRTNGSDCPRRKKLLIGCRPVRN